MCIGKKRRKEEAAGRRWKKRKDTKREEWCVTGKWNRGEKKLGEGKKKKREREKTGETRTERVKGEQLLLSGSDFFPV